MNTIIIGTKGKENQSWFYYMCYCGKAIVAKEAKLLSLPLPQLAVSNGRWFHLQLFCYLCVLPPECIKIPKDTRVQRKSVLQLAIRASCS